MVTTQEAIAITMASRACGATDRLGPKPIPARVIKTSAHHLPLPCPPMPTTAAPGRPQSRDFASSPSSWPAASFSTPPSPCGGHSPTCLLYLLCFLDYYPRAHRGRGHELGAKAEGNSRRLRAPVLGGQYQRAL